MTNGLDDFGDQNRRDGEALAGFLKTLISDLNTVTWIRGPLFAADPDSASPARLYMLGAMNDAWREVRETTPQVVIAALELPADLRRSAGLSQMQLQFKLAAWRVSRAELVEAFEDGVDPREVQAPFVAGGPAWEAPDVEPDRLEVESLPGLAETPLPPNRPRRLRRALKKLAKTLGLSDVVLESLAGIVNVAEPLKEFKQATEKISGDVADGNDDQDERPDQLDI